MGGGSYSVFQTSEEAYRVIATETQQAAISMLLCGAPKNLQFSLRHRWLESGERVPWDAMVLGARFHSDTGHRYVQQDGSMYRFEEVAFDRFMWRQVRGEGSLIARIYRARQQVNPMEFLAKYVIARCFHDDED